MALAVFTATSTTHTAKVRHNRVLCIGCGGLSGAATGNPSNTGGAAGGQCAFSRRQLAPGTGYTVAVGQAVAGSTTTNSVAGNDTTFNSTDVVAKGGAGSALVSSNSTAGTGVNGSTASGVGDTVRAGGNGGNGNASGAARGGGGGGGAGWTANGSNGLAGSNNPATGGSGDSPGDAGGNGGSSSAGVSGTAPGGAAGGAHANNATDRAGGSSVRGEARIDWIPPASLILLGVG